MVTARKRQWGLAIGRVDLRLVVGGGVTSVKIEPRQRIAWAVCVLMTCGAPWAGAGRGYVGIGTGIAYAANERFAETPVLLDYDLGFRVGALTVGYEFDSGLRTELEAAYRRNELEIIEFADARGTVNTGLHDAVDAASVMANALYQFDVGLPLRPYVGVGLGVMRLDYELSVFDTEVRILDDRESAFAYQVLAGVGVPLGQRWQLSADYRYVGHAKIDLETTLGEPVRTDHPVHQASFTLSYAFADRPMSAPAAENSRDVGWYTELRLGSIGAEDSDIDDGQPDTNFDAFDLGTAVSFAVGFARDRGRGWRAELELSRWENHADVIDFGKLRGERRLSGPVEILGASANLIYDFAPGAGLRPYAGLGVGFAEIDYDVTLHTDGTATQYVDDADSGFATQVLLGVSARLTQRLEASLNYRYWWAPWVKLQDPQGVTLKTEHSAHLLMLGLRYRLGQ